MGRELLNEETRKYLDEVMTVLGGMMPTGCTSEYLSRLQLACDAVRKIGGRSACTGQADDPFAPAAIAFVRAWRSYNCGDKQRMPQEWFDANRALSALDATAMTDAWNDPSAKPANRSANEKSQELLRRARAIIGYMPGTSAAHDAFAAIDALIEGERHYGEKVGDATINDACDAFAAAWREYFPLTEPQRRLEEISTPWIRAKSTLVALDPNAMLAAWSGRPRTLDLGRSNFPDTIIVDGKNAPSTITLPRAELGRRLSIVVRGPGTTTIVIPTGEVVASTNPHPPKAPLFDTVYACIRRFGNGDERGTTDALSALRRLADVIYAVVPSAEVCMRHPDIALRQLPSELAALHGDLLAIHPPESWRAINDCIAIVMEFVLSKSPDAARRPARALPEGFTAAPVSAMASPQWRTTGKL